MIPPGSNVGCDIMVHVGLALFVGHCQREEIRRDLAEEYGISLSAGEISELGKRFLVYLEYLDLYTRCLHVGWAVDAYLRQPLAEPKVRKALERLRKILRPIDCDVPPFARIAKDLIVFPQALRELTGRVH